VTALLDAYAAEDRLYGHGLRLSPTSARFDEDSRAWLANLAPEVRARRYRHVTEHWGWSRAHGLSRGAPMPLPSSESVVACTTRAMRELAAVAGVPVGLENLALAFGDADVDAQPAMLGRVLDAIDGVLLLDLHNLWCQAINYRRDARVLATRYPLARVRQIHVAGGGWSSSAYGEPFRRDTHDAVVPHEVIELLAWLVPHCPALEAVILERLPHALADEPARIAWRDEWHHIADVVRRAAREPVIAVPPVEHALLDHDATLEELATFQDAMAAALFDAADTDGVRQALARSRFADQVAGWDLRALEVARVLAVKWGVRQR
jgi:uncharacterized protein (UPF0276 family)